MRKGIIFSVLMLLVFSTAVSGISLGLIGGTISDPSELTYGLSSDLALLLPMIKLELELGLMTDAGDNYFSGGAKFRPKFGKLAPYGIIGISAEFNKFGFDFSNYKWFTFFGAGIHLFLMDMFSIRFDMRLYSRSDANRVRISGGVYIHL